MKRNYEEEKKLAKTNIHWGFYRNYICLEGTASRMEGERELALEKFLQVFILDCNGAENSAPIDPSYPEDLKLLMQPFNPNNAFIAPGIVERIFDLNRELHQSESFPLLDKLYKGHIKLIAELYPNKIGVPIAEIETSLLHEIDILTRFYADIEEKKALIRSKKQAQKAEIKAKKEAEKLEIKAKKDLEKAEMKAKKQADRAAIKANIHLAKSLQLRKAG